MTGIVTAAWISSTLVGSAMRATPPAARMSAGTRSSAITAAAPADSATRAWSAVTTSMITPPLSISASPAFTRKVASSRIGSDVIRGWWGAQVGQASVVLAFRSLLPGTDEGPTVRPLEGVGRKASHYASVFDPPSPIGLAQAGRPVQDVPMRAEMHYAP